MQIKATMMYLLTPVGIAIIKNNTKNKQRRRCEEKETSCTVGRNANSTAAATMQNCMEMPPKIKNRTTIQSSNSTSGYFSKENKNTNLKRYMHPYMHYSIIHNSQDMEAN